MKAVIHVVYDCVPGAYAGGVQKMVFELAGAQRRAGAGAEIWALNALRAGATEDHGGLTLRYFMPDDFLGLAKSDRLEAHLRALGPGHVLHAHNSFHPLDLQVGAVARARGFPVYYHPHGAFDPSLFRGWSFAALKKRLYIRGSSRLNLNQATGVFALTGSEEAQLRSLGFTAPITVLPNGVAPVGWPATGPASRAALGRAFRERHGLPAAARVILFVGRLNPKKRVEDILAAFATLAARDERLHLVLVGAADDAYGRTLRALAERSAFAGRIRWVGFLDESRKPAAYAAAEVFVHASVSEGMALAILEAMAHGLPVVATRGCYMAAAARAGALRECAPGAPALADALGAVLDPAADGLGAAGAAYVRQEHDWARLAERSLATYAEGLRTP
ncbi:glycosyltransferase [bacterium]|nr:glycosyltransferase [bacterium]